MPTGEQAAFWSPCEHPVPWCIAFIFFLVYCGLQLMVRGTVRHHSDQQILHHAAHPHPDSDMVHRNLSSVSVSHQKLPPENLHDGDGTSQQVEAAMPGQVMS